MPTRPPRPCLNWNRCRAYTTTGSRCPACTTSRETTRQQHRRARRPVPPAEVKRRRAAVAAWREQHGDVCPGWQRPPHPAARLSADHVIPVGAGGSEDGPLQVLCVSCNARRGTRTD